MAVTDKPESNGLGLPFVNIVFITPFFLVA